MIETHAHIYSEKFNEDRELAIERAKDVGIERIYMPNIDHTSIDTMMECEEKHPDYCFSMMGVHPCSINKDFQKELYVVEDWLSKRKFRAIGEIGMDLYWDKTHQAEQTEALEIQIGWAKKYKLPIIIHSRDSTNEVLEVLRKHNDDDLFGIFHCFGGSLEEAKSISELGFKIGIGGVVTFKNSSLSDVVKDIPIEDLVLETDCPYLPPVPYRGKRNEPSYLKLIAERVALEKEVSVKELIRQTIENSLSIFK